MLFFAALLSTISASSASSSWNDPNQPRPQWPRLWRSTRREPLNIPELPPVHQISFKVQHYYRLDQMYRPQNLMTVFQGEIEDIREDHGIINVVGRDTVELQFAFEFCYIYGQVQNRMQQPKETVVLPTQRYDTLRFYYPEDYHEMYDWSVEVTVTIVSLDPYQFFMNQRQGYENLKNLVLHQYKQDVAHNHSELGDELHYDSVWIPAWNRRWQILACRGILTLKNSFNAKCPLCREPFEMVDVTPKRKRKRESEEEEMDKGEGDCVVCFQKKQLWEPSGCDHSDAGCCRACLKQHWVLSKKQKFELKDFFYSPAHNVIY